jgi:glycosyltransferase involved in cell wall biosynthesis
MKVLSIGTDRKIFEKKSQVRQRMADYGRLFDELHIVVFSKKSLGFKEEKIAENVWVYPTNSLTRFLYIRDATTVANKIINDKKLTKETTVVSCQDPFETGKVGVTLKKQHHLNLQIQIHTDLMSPFFTSATFLNRIRTGMVRRSLEQADEVRVVSERIKRSIIKLGIPEKKIDILPIFVDQDIARRQPSYNLRIFYPDFSHIVLMASRITLEKDIETALRAFADVLNAFPHAGLVIMGEGRDKERLMSQAWRLGLWPQVVWRPWEADLVSAYKTADIFLLTSLYEGYGLTLAEAGLCETAIITTDVGIAGDVLIDGENASVCPVGNNKCLAEKIIHLLSDSELRKSFGSKAKKDIAATLPPTKEAYLQNYQALMKKAFSHEQ